MAVAESLNFTQAASAMFVTQPALSRAISSLEDEMGVRLLDRNTRSSSLTAAGRAFYKDCPQILCALREGVVKARDAACGRIGTVNLGFQRDTFERFTIEIVCRFKFRYPDIALEPCPMSVSEMLMRLGDGTVDAAITAGRTTLKDERSMLLRSRAECVVLPPDHPLASRTSIRMEELKDENFVVMSHAASSYGYNSVADKSFAAGFTPHIIQSVDYVPSVLMLVAAGKGISLLNDDLSVASYDMVKFVPLDCDNTFDRYLMWDGASTNPCLKCLIDVAEEWLRTQS